MHNGLSCSDLIVTDGISLRYGVSYCSDGYESICLTMTGTYEFEWLNDRNGKHDTFETEIDTGQLHLMARESLSVDLVRGCAHGTLILDVHVKVWKPGEQGRYHDFEAKCRTEPMNLNGLTRDVCTTIKRMTSGIETRADYSGEKSESELEHECKAVWLAFIFVILVLVILSEPLFRFGVGLMTTSKIPQPRAGLPPLPNRSGSTLEPILAGNISTQPSCKKN